MQSLTWRPQGAAHADVPPVAAPPAHGAFLGCLSDLAISEPHAAGTACDQCLEPSCNFLAAAHACQVPPLPLPCPPCPPCPALLMPQLEDATDLQRLIKAQWLPRGLHFLQTMVAVHWLWPVPPSWRALCWITLSLETKGKAVCSKSVLPHQHPQPPLNDTARSR